MLNKPSILQDAHNCCLDFDEGVSLFAVYDGHGGHEVASYSSRKLPEFIKNTEAYKKGDMKQALIDAFLGFDATLATPEVVSVLKEIASAKFPNENEEDESGNNLKVIMFFSFETVNKQDSLIFIFIFIYYNNFL